MEVAGWWKRKQTHMSKKRRRKTFKQAGKNGRGQHEEGRLLELFHEINSLLPLGGTASIVKILNSLRDDKVVEELDVADWWQRHKHAHERRRKTQASSQEGKGGDTQPCMRTFVEDGRP